uniref:CFAP97 domain containing 2 n=2 Tax=Mastacembelus armatus TaxID=205130 RepID=A0A7N9AYX1_9TELE
MEHRAYQPLLPTGNKYLQQKWDKASYDLHRRKVKSATPTINMTPPRTYGHLVLNMKKQKLEEEWTMKIQRENAILMEKISHIMKTAGGVDNRNHYDRKSLWKEKRQLELLRITKENQMILFRLSLCRPHYNVRSWHEDWVKTLKLMDSIARYPQGTAIQQKKEKPSKKSTSATTLGSARNKTECEENVKTRETSKKEVSETETQQNANVQPFPEPNAPEKSISPDTPENSGSSGPALLTTDKYPDSAETSFVADGSEMSST